MVRNTLTTLLTCHAKNKAMFIITKLLIISQAVLVTSNAAQVGLVSRRPCGSSGAVAFSSKPELAAAVTCYVTFQGCNSTDLPEAARTKVQDLGVLGELMDLGLLNAQGRRG